MSVPDDVLGPGQRSATFATNLLLLGTRGHELTSFASLVAQNSTDISPLAVRTASSFPLPPNPHRNGIDYTVVLVSLANLESIKLLQQYCATVDPTELCGRSCAVVVDAEAETTHSIDLDDIRVMAAEIRLPLRFCDFRVHESAAAAADQVARVAHLVAGKTAGVTPLLSGVTDLEFVRSTMLPGEEG